MGGEGKDYPFRGEGSGLLGVAKRASAPAWGVRWSVWPLLADNDRGHAEHVGSCLLIGIGPHRFVFTAAHILGRVPDRNLYIITHAGLVRLFGTVFRTPTPSSGSRENDVLDAGF